MTMNISPYRANQSPQNNLRTGTLITPEVAEKLTPEVLNKTLESYKERIRNFVHKARPTNRSYQETVSELQQSITILQAEIDSRS